MEFANTLELAGLRWRGGEDNPKNAAMFTQKQLMQKRNERRKAALLAKQRGMGCMACESQISGLGAWPYTGLIPECPSGYQWQMQANGQGACVAPQPWFQNPQYGPYGANQAVYYARDPQSCVRSGGMWDSFNNQCLPMNSNYTPGYGYVTPSAGSPSGCIAQGGLWDSFSTQCSIGGQSTAAQTMPNVLGAQKWNAVALLNNAGYSVWLLSENGIPQGSPSDYNPRRVQIIVINGVVTATQVG